MPQQANIQVLPLAPLQEGLLFHALGNDSSLDVYSMQSTYTFSKAPEPAIVQAACQTLLERHDMLRAGFTVSVAQHPVQFITDQVRLDFSLHHLEDQSWQQAQDELHRIERDQRQQRFDMDKPPLIRFVYLLLPQGRAALVVTNHHILLDGWSESLIIVELLSHIRAGGTDHSLEAPAPFANYLAWLQEQDSKQALKTWKQALAGLEHGTLVGPAQADTEAILPSVTELNLGSQLCQDIKNLARTCAVSESTVYSAVWALLLRSLTGSDDLVFGTTVSGREAEVAAVEAMIGLFLNTLPQRVQFDPFASVQEFLQRSQQHQGQVVKAHHCGLSAIQQTLGIGQLFDTLYIMRNTPQDDQAFAQLQAETSLEDLSGGDATHYPLTFIVHPDPQGYRLILSYRHDIISQQRAEKLLARAKFLLSQLVANPQAKMGSLQTLQDYDYRRALEQGQGEQHSLSQLSILHELEKTVAQVPHRVALADGRRELTYSQFWSSISANAKQLKEAGVKPGDLVAIDLLRGVGSVLALFAVLAIGAAYLPLDRSHPPARRKQLLEQTGVAALITDATGDLKPANLPSLPLLISSDPAEPGLSASQLYDRYSPDDLAYLIFTSGSTGNPKAVQVAHRGLVNMLANHRRKIFEPSGASWQRPFNIAHIVSFAFDMSWEELLWLLDGHKVTIVDEQTRLDAADLVDFLEKHRIDVLNVTPSLCQALLEQGLLSRVKPKLVLLGGEAVSKSIWSTLYHAQGTVGYNLYGPTEYTINTLGGGTLESSSPIVGYPIDNTAVFVLDSSLAPVDDGVPGELWVSGAGLANGYQSQTGLTASRFVACPFGEAGQVMYRTGDLVSRRANGLIDFLGRNDEQVKIRGFRVEPAEVQALIEQDSRVRQCAVLAKLGPGGTKVLVAYVVWADAGDQPGSQEAELLRARLRKQVPDHLVPAFVVPLESMPLTANSKLDTAALPQPDFSAHSKQPAQTPLEAVICAVFADVLGLEDFGAEDDFFALGGHSLLAMKAAASIGAQWGRRVSVASLMQAGTARALAARLEGGQDEQGLLLSLGGQDKGSELPVFYLHPALGLGWSFSTLAARLPGRPAAWAVQSPGLLGWPQGQPENLGQLAQQLAQAIASCAPRQIRLVGWSFGAHLLAALGQSLAEHGIEVAQSVLLDPGFATGWRPPQGQENPAKLAGSEQELANLAQQEALNFLLRADGRPIPDWLGQPPYRAEDVLEHLHEGSSLYSYFSDQQLAALVDCYRVNSLLLEEAKPVQPAGRVYLVTATADKSSQEVEQIEASWTGLVPGLSCLRLETDHEGMTSPWAAEQLAQLIDF